jgi:UDP-glucose 4-epimerase
VIAKFMQLAAENNPLGIDWDGLQSRDFVSVKDVVQANLLAATKGVPGEIYNVASGRTYTLLELADTIERVSGRKLERISRPKRPGDVHESSADISKITALGYKASVTLEEGLKEMWAELTNQ